MNITDLMLGNIIFSLIDNDGVVLKKICKVEGIRCDGHYVLTDYSDVWYEIDTFLPILLTQDILEKNGWTEIVLKDRFYNQDFAMPVLTKSFDKRNLFWFYISETPVFPINYVHELQNLLHLCGIEKEIEL